MTLRGFAEDESPGSSGQTLEASIAALDWSSTPLGPRAEWPQSLRRP